MDIHTFGIGAYNTLLTDYIMLIMFINNYKNVRNTFNWACTDVDPSEVKVNGSVISCQRVVNTTSNASG